jgi:hypothetical protein
MGKLLAVSIVVVPLLIARHQAGRRNPRAAVRRTLQLVIAFNALWVLAMVYLFFRLH